MSKRPKTDFMALIAGEVAPTIGSSTDETAKAEAPAATIEPREVVTLAPRRAAPPKAGEGTLKQRAHQLSVYLEAPVYDRLRDIAHDERTKLHPLILEAIDLLLKKRGAPSIKELIKRTG
jgi:hypothetical protein